MPKLYNYLGIIIYFYSDEHLPVHVHGKFAEYESKAEIIFIAGAIKEVRLRTVKGRRPLKKKERELFLEIVNDKAQEIVEKWFGYFVKGIKPVTIEIKTKK